MVAGRSVELVLEDVIAVAIVVDFIAKQSMVVTAAKIELMDKLISVTPKQVLAASFAYFKLKHMVSTRPYLVRHKTTVAEDKSQDRSFTNSS